MSDRTITPNLSESDAYEVALAELLKLEFFGMKLGLQNISALMELLDHPERAYKTIHIAGTNGKGSVAAMLASVLQASGKRVGLYTSPHLVNFRERIKVNGEMVPQDYIRSFLSGYWNQITQLRATFFEVTTAMAFAYFRSANVDIAVIETGLGGRLDATNVLQSPLATVVTSIGWDHTKQLGNTLESIAWEKAGIFKNDSPAVVNVEEPLRPIFTARAHEVGCELYFVEPNIDANYASTVSPLTGAHQQQNLRTVLTTLSVLADRPDGKSIRDGISRVGELTGLRARLENYVNAYTREHGITIILDVGHNVDAIRAIKREFLKNHVRPIVVVGLMRDKEIDGILKQFREFTSSMVAVNADSERALPSSELTEAAQNIGLTAFDGGTVQSGVLQAMERANSGDTILICGSHYVVGEFLENETS